MVAIELLAATRVAAASEDGLSDVLRLVREAAAKTAESDAVDDRDIGAVAALVRSGALSAAVGVPLPSATLAPAGRSRPR